MSNLFANPSFINGVAYLLDFNGTYTVYNLSHNHQEADAQALYSDWLYVGNDLADAINVIGFVRPKFD